MEIRCSFDDFIFNTGEKFYRCTIFDPLITTDHNFLFPGVYSHGKSNIDVTFVEIQGFCDKIPKRLTNYFPNLKVLGVYNAELKVITKDDMAEYRNLERFIVESCKVEFLPHDLFEDFKNLKFIKFFRNNLSIVEPNILDGFDKLEYVNFQSNPNYSKFYSAHPIYVSNATLEELINHLYEQFFTQDKEVIWNYVESHPNKAEILRIFRERSNDVHLNFKIHELTYKFYEQNRIKDVAEHEEFEAQLRAKITELELSNEELNAKIKNFKDLESKRKQQIEELMIDIGNERDEKMRLKRSLQAQIDGLVQQLQSVLLVNTT